MDASRLIYMAEQIARNLSAGDEEKAAEETYLHLRQFWTPDMIFELVTSPVSDLGATLQNVVQRLKNDAAG